MAIETPERDRREDGEAREEVWRGGTYRTLDEQEGKLWPAQERFERRGRTIGLFLGPIVLAVLLLIPFDLDGNQHRLLAILGFVVVWWVTPPCRRPRPSRRWRSAASSLRPPYSTSPAR